MAARQDKSDASFINQPVLGVNSSKEHFCTKYSLVQWNWFSDVTWCTWVACIQWRLRTNFTAPGCRAPKIFKTRFVFVSPFNSDKTADVSDCCKSLIVFVFVYTEKFVAHSSNVNCAALGSNSGRVLATGGEDRKVYIWAVGKPNVLTVGWSGIKMFHWHFECMSNRNYCLSLGLKSLTNVYCVRVCVRACVCVYNYVMTKLYSG